MPPEDNTEQRVLKLPGAKHQPIAWLSTQQIFDELPPTPWISRGLMLGPGRPVLLAGYGASAKTLTSQALALAVASGRPIWNHFEVSESSQVVHFDYEQGEHATRRRYQRLALGHGIDTPELCGRLRLAVLPRVTLDGQHAAEIFAAEFDGSKLAVIDSLRAAAPNVDENDSSIRRCVDALTYASTKTGCAVWLIHHAGKPQDRHADARMIARGSSAIFDACGNVLVIAQGKQKTDARTVAQTKVPAEAEGVPLADFQLVIEDVDLVDVRAAGVRVVFRPAADHDAAAAAKAATEHDRDSRKLLKVVRDNAGAVQETIASKSGMRKSRVIQLLMSLIAEGHIAVLDGPHGSKTYRPEVDE